MHEAAPSEAANINARAVEWLLERRDNENWSDEDQARLDAWLAQSPAHLVAYWRAEDGWKRTELLSSVRPLTRQTYARKGSWESRAQIAAAAAIVLVAGVAAYFRFFGSHEHVFSTPIGGYEAIALSDGSRIELNTDTVLRTRMDGNQRTITLDRGEAYFKVKHDPAHPLVVMVGDHRITDLGTKFTVRRKSDGVEVSLLEGRVRLGSIDGDAPSQQALLLPGERAIATANRFPCRRQVCRNSQRKSPGGAACWCFIIRRLRKLPPSSIATTGPRSSSAIWMPHG